MHHKKLEEIVNLWAIAELLEMHPTGITLGQIARNVDLCKKTVSKHLSALEREYSAMRYEVHSMSGAIGYKYVYKPTHMTGLVVKKLGREVRVNS